MPRERDRERRGRSRSARRPRREEPRSDDVGYPPEEEILRLVAERENHRHSRRYKDSDAIREELRAMGVEIFDREKEWKCRDGRRGSLFTAGPAECYLTDAEIEDRVRQREDARSSKDWGLADSLRDELRAAGVEMDDKDSQWRTAGGRRGSYRGGGGGFAAPESAPRSSSSAIRALVAERERHRAAMDFEAADDLRRQLSALGVELFDSDRTWKSADGQRGVILTGGHDVDCRLSDYEVSGRVMQREDARSVKDFSKADMIRDDLRRNGVELLDGQRMWVTTDGRQGSYGGIAAVGHTPMPVAAPLAPPRIPAYLPAETRSSRRAPPSEAPVTVSGSPKGLPASNVTNSPSSMTFATASIVALVAGREKARNNKDWAAADDIRNDLRSHGVDVWDKEKVWRANDGRSGKMIH